MMESATMNLEFDTILAADYGSASQRARVLTEHWVACSFYCPNCGCSRVDRFPNNQPVADFFCPSCREEYELKSKRDTIGTKVIDGAYHPKMARLRSSTNPNLLLLSYNLQNSCVLDLCVIPKQFFVQGIVEERRPLAATARRAGWIGSNILLHKVPDFGKLFLVRNRKALPKESVLSQWRKTLFLRETTELSARRWLLDVMNCVEKVGKREFSLHDVYSFETELQRLYPDNRHIRDKIRQQLQVLRDSGYIEFVRRGNYRLR